MTSNPPLYPLQGGELDRVRPLRVPLLGGVQGWVYENLKRLWPVFCAIASMSLLGVNSAGAENLQRPNILLIVADDLGCYGGEIATPNLDLLAKMKELGIVSSETPLSPRSPFWDWGQTESAENPAWETLPSDRRSDLARRMAIYAAMVDRMDQNIGRIVSDLQLRDEFENTLIVFLPDNGACAEWEPYGFDVRSSSMNMLHADEKLAAMGGPGTFHSVGSGWANENQVLPMPTDSKVGYLPKE